MVYEVVIAGDRYTLPYSTLYGCGITILPSVVTPSVYLSDMDVASAVNHVNLILSLAYILL